MRDDSSEPTRSTLGIPIDDPHGNGRDPDKAKCTRCKQSRYVYLCAGVEMCHECMGKHWQAVCAGCMEPSDVVGGGLCRRCTGSLRDFLDNSGVDND